jgi:hypothetical protein
MARNVAMDKRARGDHLGVEPGVRADLAQEVPAVPIRPIHHGRNGDSGTVDISGI